MILDLAIDKLGFNKIKNSCVSKGTINRVKRQPVEWEKIFIYVYLVKDYYAECIEAPPTKNQAIQLKNWQRT